MTIKMECTCFHEYQNEKYGPGIRVFNEMQSGSNARCTVCGTVKERKHERPDREHD